MQGDRAVRSKAELALCRIAHQQNRSPCCREQNQTLKMHACFPKTPKIAQSLKMRDRGSVRRAVRIAPLRLPFGALPGPKLESFGTNRSSNRSPYHPHTYPPPPYTQVRRPSCEGTVAGRPQTRGLRRHRLGRRSQVQGRDGPYDARRGASTLCSRARPELGRGEHLDRKLVQELTGGRRGSPATWCCSCRACP